MDPKEIAHINSNIFNLTQTLDYDFHLTTFLQQKDHIGRADIEAMNILKQNQGNAAAIHDLLRRLMGRPNSYKSLIDAARTLKQQQAVDILEALYKTEEGNPGPSTESGEKQTLTKVPMIETTDAPEGAGGEMFDAEDQDIPQEVLDFIHSTEALDVIVERPMKPNNFVDPYNLPTRHKGLALILNIIEFDNEEVWKRRTGSDKDVENLTELLYQLHYEVYPKGKKERVRGRKTKLEIMELLQEFKWKCEIDKPPSIIVFIGSHGFHPNKIVTSDPPARDAYGKGYHVALDLYEDIVQEFFHNNCPVMKGKPKIFVVQACQEFLRNEIDSSVLREPNITDSIICTAEMPGGVANRDRFKGSWFVHCFTYMMMKHVKDKSFQEILEMVKVMLGRIKGVGGTRQVPVITSQDMQKLYFPLEPEM